MIDYLASKKLINRLYAWWYKIDLREFLPLESYNNLQDLFTRSLSRKRNLSKSFFISPVDGMIIQQGIIKKNILYQIKGSKYRLSELLTIDEYLKGTYMTFYLSPKDYHHFHSPCDMEIKRKIHIPGKLFVFISSDKNCIFLF